MNSKLHLFALTVSLISLSCNGSSKNDLVKTSTEIDSISLLGQEKQGQNVELKTGLRSDNSNIKMIDSKKEIRELDGNFNQMTLFEVNKDISLEELKEYCSRSKPNYSDGYFQILVFFKKQKSARFPDNPVTGIFMEESDLKNIKAVYTINNINGYSKLDYYDNNNWESSAQTIDIN